MDIVWVSYQKIVNFNTDMMRFNLCGATCAVQLINNTNFKAILRISVSTEVIVLNDDFRKTRTKF